MCHGPNLGGGRDEALGPMGRMVVPNITTGKGGRGNLYTDGQLARLIKHGVRHDGTTIRLMPANDFTWWPEEDVVAVVSWVRAQPPVDGDPGLTELGVMAKILDRIDSIPFDVARRIDHEHLPTAPPRAADATYGAFVGTSCRGCHGPTLSGGPLPGAPPDLPVPLNLTSHQTGLAGWTYDDFVGVIRSGKRRNGQPLKPLMSTEALRHLDDVELHALWAYLQSVPPKPFGGR
jgi:mono/diheme cytochrome c family protein